MTTKTDGEFTTLAEAWEEFLSEQAQPEMFNAACKAIFYGGAVAMICALANRIKTVEDGDRKGQKQHMDVMLKEAYDFIKTIPQKPARGS
jgi:hypothetical protein